jgi:NADH-quinone oxidoreductase subunit M
MLGIATLTDVGINAAVIGMVAHGLITGLLFFLAGSMSHRYHTREMSRLGGNMKLMPVMGGILAFTAMASLGLPGLAGFWGEFMSLIGAYNPLAGLSLGVFRTSMVLGAVGTVLTAGYMLYLLQQVNLGEPGEEWQGREFRDVDRFELTAWVPLIVLIVVIGFYPKLVFNATTDSVVSLIDTIFNADTTASVSRLAGG